MKKRRELVVSCYVIDHPDGTLLWDGGYLGSSDQAGGKQFSKVASKPGRSKRAGAAKRWIWPISQY